VDGQGRVIGRFTAAGIRPRLLDQLEERGLEIPREIAPLFHESVPSAQ